MHKIYKKNLILNLIFFSFVIIFFSIPLLKYLSVNANVADFGFFQNEIFLISEGFYWRAFHDHINFISIAFSFIYKIFGQNFFIFILILQSFCLLSPLLFYKKNKKFLFLYLFFPPILYINFNDFHYETLAYPIILLNLYLINKNSRYSFFVLLILPLIKETYAVLSVFILTYDYLINRNRLFFVKFSFVIIICVIYFFVILPGFHQGKELNDTVNFIIKNSNFSYIILLKVSTLFFIYIYFNFDLKKDKLIFINHIPYLLIAIFLTNNHGYSSFSNHYFLIILPFVVYAYVNNKDVIKLNFLSFDVLSCLRVISIIIFLPLPFSVIYYTDLNSYKIHDYINDLNKTKYFKNFIKKYDYGNVLLNKNVVIQNNLYHPYFHKSKSLKLFNQNNFYKNAEYTSFRNVNLVDIKPDLILISESKKCFNLDKSCKNVNLLNDQNYELIYKDSIFNLYELKN